MSWLNIVKCYNEIVKDPSLLWLFLETECTSLWELSVLGALQFRLISERHFTYVASPDIWRKVGVEFIPDTGLRTCEEVTHMAILITDGVGEGNLGMVTTFYHHNQNKMESSDALPAICQCNAPEPSVVVTRRHTNTPYIPCGTSWPLYLYTSTHPKGTSSAKFPLDCLCLWRLLTYFKTKVLLPH